MQEDFFISHKDQNGWSKMENAGYPLNTEDNEGAQTISADGRLMVFIPGLTLPANPMALNIMQAHKP